MGRTGRGNLIGQMSDSPRSRCGYRPDDGKMYCEVLQKILHGTGFSDLGS